jgi:hypothetical protein
MLMTFDFSFFSFIPPAGHFGKYKASSSLVARYGAVASNRRVHVCGCKRERQKQGATAIINVGGIMSHFVIFFARVYVPTHPTTSLTLIVFVR